MAVKRLLDILFSVHTNRYAFSGGIIIVFVFVYFYFVYNSIVNFPFSDEYELLHFLDQFTNSSSFIERFNLMFSQHNEHRIAFIRLTAMVDYYIFGELNFNHLVVFGNIIVIFSTPFLLYKILRINFSDLLFTQIMFLMIAIPIAGFANWSFSVLTIGCGLIFSIYSLYFLDKDYLGSQFFSLFFAFLATYTVGNGILVFPCGFLLLFWKGRPLFSWASWLIVAGLCIYLYFYGYVAPPQHHSVFYTVVHEMKAFLVYPFLFLGAIFKSLYTSHIYLGATFGLLISAYVIVILVINRKYFLRDNPLVLAILVFFFMTLSVTAMSRAGLGVGQALAPRYQFISCFFIVLVYGISLVKYREFITRNFGLILVLCMLIFIIRYADEIQILGNQEEDIKSELWAYFTGDDLQLTYPDTRLAIRRLRKAKNIGTYDATSALENPSQIILTIPEHSGNISYFIDDFKETPNVLLVEGWAFSNIHNGGDIGKFLVLKSDRNQFIFKASKVIRSDLSKNLGLNRTDLDEAGFKLSLYKPGLNIDAGVYDLLLYLKFNNGSVIRPLNMKVSMEESYNEDIPITYSSFEQDPLYNIDQINEVNNLSRAVDPGVILIDKDSILIRGWAVDIENKNLATAVTARIGDQSFESTLGLARPDVSRVLNSTKYTNSGFEVTIPTKSLVKGLNLLYLRIENHYDQFYESNPIKIFIQVDNNQELLN